MPDFSDTEIPEELADAIAPDESHPDASAGLPPQILDLARQGIVLLDRKGNINTINAEARRLLHCAAAGATGRNFWEAVPDEIAEFHRKATRKMLASAGHYAFQAHHEFEDHWIEYSFARIASGYVVNLTDISASQRLQRQLERSERQNRLLFGANPNAMWIFDALSLRILAANDAATAFYGIGRKSFLRLSMGALFPDGEGASILSSLGTLKAAGDVQLSAQICKQRKGDGELVLVELACGRISWNDQRAVLVTIADVTERHLAERDLRREHAAMEEALAATQAELETTSRDLAAFTYALSNDLQGPLHAADGFAAMLLEKYSVLLEGPGRHYVNRIQASTRQLAKLVDDLRLLVQLPPTGLMETFDLKALCDGVFEGLRSRHPDRQPLIEMDAGLMLTADRSLTATALTCLLDNALKFTSRKAEGWVKVGMLAGETPGERIVQVSDNGTGFDAAYATRLFTAFQRLHSSVEFPGNGLGLAIVKRVADRHGGRVWAETSPAGASFFMSFPGGGGSGSTEPAESPGSAAY